LKPEATSEALKDNFTNYGEVVSVAVKDWESQTNTRKLRYAFVAFKTPEEANKARNEAPGSEEIRKLFVDEKPYINIFQPKEQRNKFLQTQFRTRHQQQTPNFGPFQYNPEMQRHLSNQNRRLPPIFPPFAMGQPMGQVPPPRMGGGYQPMNRKPMSGPRMGGGQWQDRQRLPPRPMGQMGGGDRPPMRGGPMGDQMAKNRQYGGHQPFDRSGQQQQKPQQRFEPGMQKAQPQAPIDPKTGKAGETPASSSITLADLKNKWQDFVKLDKDKQRNILGELLFPLIKERVGESIAPKITGMLIDLDVLEIQEIFEFLEDRDLLNERIEEAKELILSEQA